MAFEELNFTRDWTVKASAEEGGFPTYEPDEATVRADMQFLYNEIRDYLNNKLVKLLNSPGTIDQLQTSSGETLGTALERLEEYVEDGMEYILRVGSSAPDDTRVLWMDTATKMLKYHDGEAWTPVVTDTSTAATLVATDDGNGNVTLTMEVK